MLAFMNACIVSMCPMLPEDKEDISFPETGITDGCDHHVNIRNQI